MSPRSVLPLLAALLLVFLVLPSGGTALAKGDEPEALGRLAEILLPPYQQGSLGKDLPAADLRFTDDQTLVVLGTSALWRWHFNLRSLQRLILWPAGEGVRSPLRYLGGDGLNLFAAADTMLFQIQWQQSKVFRYPLSGGGQVRGFAGGADDFWLLHSRSLLQFDRYGKTLAPKVNTPGFGHAEHLAYDDGLQLLWAVRGHDLLRVDLKRKKTPLVVFSAKHPLLALDAPEVSGGDVVTHTAHAVLRFSSAGKLKQSIPVEGSRVLLAMALGRTAHAYLFSDQLLEVFDLKEHQAVRYHLPLEEGDEVSRMQLQAQHLALLVNGRPRLFRLDIDSRKR